MILHFFQGMYHRTPFVGVAPVYLTGNRDTGFVNQQAQHNLCLVGFTILRVTFLQNGFLCLDFPSTL